MANAGQELGRVVARMNQDIRAVKKLGKKYINTNESRQAYKQILQDITNLSNIKTSLTSAQQKEANNYIKSLTKYTPKAIKEKNAAVASAAVASAAEGGGVVANNSQNPVLQQARQEEVALTTQPVSTGPNASLVGVTSNNSAIVRTGGGGRNGSASSVAASNVAGGVRIGGGSGPQVPRLSRRQAILQASQQTNMSNQNKSKIEAYKNNIKEFTKNLQNLQLEYNTLSSSIINIAKGLDDYTKYNSNNNSSKFTYNITENNKQAVSQLENLYAEAKKYKDDYVSSIAKINQLYTAISTYITQKVMPMRTEIQSSINSNNNAINPDYKSELSDILSELTTLSANYTKLKSTISKYLKDTTQQQIIDVILSVFKGRIKLLYIQSIVKMISFEISQIQKIEFNNTKIKNNGTNVEEHVKLLQQQTQKLKYYQSILLSLPLLIKTSLGNNIKNNEANNTLMQAKLNTLVPTVQSLNKMLNGAKKSFGAIIQAKIQRHDAAIAGGINTIKEAIATLKAQIEDKMTQIHNTMSSQTGLRQYMNTNQQFSTNYPNLKSALEESKSALDTQLHEFSNVTKANLASMSASLSL